MRKTIREDDLVSVREPIVVVRCGYPKCVDDFMPQARDLAAQIGFKAPLSASKNSSAERIAREIARGLLAQAGFGGRERTLHTRIDESMRGQVYRVAEVRRVMTGTYCGGYSGSFECGYADAEGPSLENQKPHFLAALAPRGQFISDTKDLPWVELCNLELAAQRMEVG